MSGVTNKYYYLISSEAATLEVNLTMKYFVGDYEMAKPGSRAP